MEHPTAAVDREPPSGASQRSGGDTTAALLRPDAAVPLELADGTVRTVLRHGDGVPTLLIQGMAATHGHWGRWFLDGLLTAGRQLISVNHVGVARSSRAPGPYTIADLADDQAAALDALGIDGPIDVFGISMGGMTAQELALRHPERVRSLVLGCTTPGHVLGTWTEPLVTQGLVEALQSGDGARALRASWEINVSAEFASHEDAYAEFVAVTSENRVSLRVISEQMQAIGGHDTAGRLSAIDVPVTVVHGSDDQMLPYPNAPVLAEEIPGARLETLPATGHLFFWEHPEVAVRVALETAARAA
ncbi:alpha/beta hydrolase [Patulibacter medicamentivorans]|uniref:Alpha/beta hydrolase n=1 Tax=Patulibacter medicamentivorans TaxID=1097667 RepID=H0E7J5_9ACTN|nr:alpha/beta hydrolase [Patulibacter medicamentivorans]EHN10366.1 alpha/beta hydrolase [Patulibacter medicamentivorans]